MCGSPCTNKYKVCTHHRVHIIHTKLCGRLFHVLNRSLCSSSSLYGRESCFALLSYLVPFMFNKVMYGYWPLIRIACLANVWRAVRFLSQIWIYLYVAILSTYRCTMLWSSSQVVCTSGSIEFPNKSHNSFVVCFESLATFDEFKVYSYIINNKLKIWEQFVIKNDKYCEEKQASLKLTLAVTMPTAFVRSYTEMRRISHHVFF
jgi:hypothetical protein